MLSPRAATLTAAILSAFIGGSSANAEQRIVVYEVEQQILPGRDPEPMPGLGLMVESVDFGLKKDNLRCADKTNYKGLAECYLEECNLDAPFTATYRLEFEERDAFHGPRLQEIPVKGCDILKEIPITLQFIFKSYASIKKAEDDMMSIVNAGISGSVLAGRLKAAEFGDELVRAGWHNYVGVATAGGINLGKFVYGARDLSALYLEVANSVASEETRAEAQRRADQWSAYAVVATNVGLQAVAVTELSMPPSSGTIIVSPKPDAVSDNARILANEIRQSPGGGNSQRLQEIKVGAEHIANSNRLGEAEFSAWSKVIGGGEANLTRYGAQPF